MPYGVIAAIKAVKHLFKVVVGYADAVILYGDDDSVYAFVDTYAYFAVLSGIANRIVDKD